MSANSKAGMRYAIQLAQLMDAEVTFLHVHMVLRASSWSDATYHYYIDQEKKALDKELNSFVRSVYRSMKLEVGEYKAVVKHTFDTSDSIMAYAKKHNFDFVCISARGAGTLTKLFGTVTGALISRSPVPVVCVPKDYRTRPISSVLYASDLSDYERELKQVIAFARPLKAEVEMLHLSYPFQMIADEALVEQSLKQKFDYPVDLHYQQRDIEDSVMADIEKAVKKSKPSVVAMFTKQKQSFFERLIIGSASKEFSFKTKVPLVVFPKKK